MEKPVRGGIGQWLKARCQKEGLSLRQAASKTGLSHATIADIMSGAQASPQTIKKLATAFGGDGPAEGWYWRISCLPLPAIEASGPRMSLMSHWLGYWIS